MDEVKHFVFIDLENRPGSFNVRIQFFLWEEQDCTFNSFLFFPNHVIRTLLRKILGILLCILTV